MLKSSSSSITRKGGSSSRVGSKGASSAGSIFDIDLEKDVSYINLTILDASQAVEAMVKEKLAEKSINNSKFFSSIIRPPEKFRNKVHDKIASAVANNIPVSSIAKGLAESMPKLLMYKIATKTGMKLAAETVFVEDSYVVIQFQIQYVDSQKLIGLIKSKSKTSSSSGSAEEVNDDDDDDDDSIDPDPKVIDEWIQEQKELGLEGGSEFFYDDYGDDNKEGDTTSNSNSNSNSNNNINNNHNINNSNSKDWKMWIVDCLEWAIQQLLPDRTVKNLEHDHLPAILQTKITEQMQSMMELKLAKKNLEADILVLPSKDQSRYFFSNLITVRNRQEQKEK
jgi:hypothetical protein